MVRSAVLKMKRDEHGYINNRGLSKYWGVTISGDAESWIVSYKPVDDEKTHTMSANDFTLKEVDAARIAAYALDKGCKRNVIMRGEGVLSADKQWVYYIRGNDIHRMRYSKQKVHVNDVVVKLFDVAEVVKPAVKPEDMAVLKKAAKKAAKKPDDKESQRVANLTNLILDGNLSERSTRALIAVLQSTIK